MYIIIDGVDISQYIKAGGYKWSRNDVDGPEAGRITMDAEMHRDRRAIKYRLDLSCLPLRQEDAEILLSLIEPEYVTVQTMSPRHGPVTWRMYSNNVPASLHSTSNSGEDLWDGISFPLIQK